MRILLSFVFSMIGFASYAQDDVHYLEQTFTFSIRDGEFLGGPLALVTANIPCDNVSLLQSSAVLDDLQLVDEQKAQLAERIANLTKEHQRQAGELTKSMDGSAASMARFEELRQKYFKDVQSASEEILLPFQLERLRQVRRQSLFRTGGISSLESSELSDVLDLSEKQLKELREKAAEAENKLVKEFQELQQRRRREVLEGVLTKEQLRKLDEAFGEPILDESKLVSEANSKD